MSGAALALGEWFARLDGFLCQGQRLWRPKPFTEPVLAWEAEFPELAAWLRGRSLDQAEAAHRQLHLPEAPEPFAQWAAQAESLTEVSALPMHRLDAAPSRLNVAVPGRKWQQIQAFAHCLPNTAQAHWLDWCAGKGHLGRLLVSQGGQLTCLEQDAELVAEGQRLSDRQHFPAQHLQQDVLAESVASQLHAQHYPVALHACGELHVRLLKLASQAGCAQLAVAPCCYNRIFTDNYQPLSQAGQRSTLLLSRDDLRLSLSETATAGARERRLRDQSMAWRLGFDQWQRQLRGIDQYLPTPSLPIDWLKRPFAEYCLALAERKALKVAPPPDWSALEQSGWARLAVVRNLELVRSLYRRPLELWLVLDRALYLQEQGYRVELGCFCASTLTPRNLLLLAQRL